ncbi:Rhodanese-like protein [Serendipita vermifera]|nr:Rhodanese-like protein [Serendipita vermifera]
MRHNASQAGSSPAPKKTLNPDWSAPIVTYEEVKARARKPVAGTYLIDVREKDEVAQGMIPTAVNIPLSGFIESIRASPEEFHAKHGFQKPQKDQEIIFYCRSGKRSASAADSAKDNGFTNIKNYSGSWLDWVKKTQENDYNL